MGTRGSFGIEEPDGSVSAIYCGHDSYLSHAGDILVTHYGTPEKFRALLALGDVSSVAETLDKTEDYHRKAGEPYDDVKPRTFKDVSDYCDNGFDVMDAAYLYLMSGSTWFVSTRRGADPQPITRAMIEKDN